MVELINDSGFIKGGRDRDMELPFGLSNSDCGGLGKFMLRVLRSAMSVLALGIGLHGIMFDAAEAASPATAPEDVLSLLASIETAANAQDIEKVMDHYSETFSSDTGFDYSLLQQTLENLWDQYHSLTYDIELVSWEADGQGRYVIETVTRVEGTQIRPERRLMLASAIESRQRVESGQIVSQATLSENSQMTSGDSPPEVAVHLPESVAPGETYTFDAIVVEPLAGRSLMGVANEEGVTVEDFLEPRPVVLDVLSAGGLYKIGEAPAAPDQRWVSAVIIREDGFIVDTRRLQVVEGAQNE